MIGVYMDTLVSTVEGGYHVTTGKIRISCAIHIVQLTQMPRNSEVSPVLVVAYLDVTS